MPPATPANIQTILQQFPQVGILPRSFLLSEDFSTFATELKGSVEIIRWTYYAFKAYVTGGATQILLFDQNVGLATNGLGDTDMQVGGQLAGGEAMIIRNIRVVPIPAAADVVVASATSFTAMKEWYDVLTKACWLEFKVGDKIYAQGAPLTLFPAGSGIGTFVAGGGAGAIAASHVNNGDPSNRALWEADPPLYVPSTRTLSLSLNWKAAVTVTTQGRIGAYLDGWRVRVVQ